MGPCDVYEEQLWCTKSGGRGSGWHEEWGVFDGFSFDGVPATEACCACGGGTVPFKQVKNQTALFLTVGSLISLFFILFLLATTCYYRRRYNKIAYAAPGAATIGKIAVNEGPEELPEDSEDHSPMVL